MEQQHKRSAFSGKIGFVLSAAGASVGLGNIWRFPIMVSVWGGMTFLIPYFICVLLIGSRHNGSVVQQCGGTYREMRIRSITAGGCFHGCFH